MIVRNFAEFRSTLPTESGEVGSDGDEKYARPVADAIREILQGLGYEVDPPMDAGIDGWEFEVRVKGYPTGGRYWCKVTYIPPDHVLMLHNPSWWDRVREVYPPTYIEALRALAREMAVDPRFSEVRWQLPEDATRDLPGSSHPIDD